MPVSFVYIKQLGDTEETLLKPIKELKGLTNKSRTAGGRQAKEEGSLEPKRQGFQSFFQLSELGSAWLAGLESGVPQLQMSRSCNKGKKAPPWDLGDGCIHTQGWRLTRGLEELPAQHGWTPHAAPGCSRHDSGSWGSPLTSTRALQSAAHVNAGIPDSDSGPNLTKSYLTGLLQVLKKIQR